MQEAFYLETDSAVVREGPTSNASEGNNSSGVREPHDRVQWDLGLAEDVGLLESSNGGTFAPQPRKSMTDIFEGIEWGRFTGIGSPRDSKSFSPEPGEVSSEVGQTKERITRSEVDSTFILKSELNSTQLEFSSGEVEKGFDETSEQVEKQESADVAWKDWWEEKSRLDDEFWLAAQLGDAPRLRDLLAERAAKDLSPDAKSLDNWTALHLAADAGHVECVEALLAGGGDQREKTTTGFLPLHLAAQRGHLSVAKALLDKTDLYAAATESGVTPLHLASERGHRDVLQLFLEEAPDAAASVDFLGRAPAEIACDAETFELLGGYHSFERTYERTLFGNVLLRNSRADHVKALLYKTQYMPMGRALVRQQGPGSTLTRARTKKVTRTKKSFLTLRKDTVLENPGPDGFIIESELGKGSFGEVYKVREKCGEGKEYAMKLLEKAKILGHNLTRYAVTERNVLSYSSNHNHPYLMKLFFAFQTSQHLVLILEYCEGGSMRRLIQLAKQLDEDVVTLYAAEVLLALEFLHERNILYRDLKPDNVVFKDRHCMLTDFGLSKESKSERSTSFCGSSAYLAPEMLKRQGHGHSVDIYGLGVLAFEMRTGTPPFYTRNKDELFKNIESANLRMPTHFSTEMADFVQKVMERSVEKRLGSANTKDVRAHPLFAREGIDWDKLLLKEVEAPVWPAAAQQRPRHRPVRSSALQHRGSRRHVPGWNYVSPQVSGRPPEAPVPEQKSWSLW